MPGVGSLVGEDARWKLIGFVRLLSLGPLAAAEGEGATETYVNQALVEVRRGLDAAVDAYRLGDDRASSLAADAYLVFEPLEPRIAAHDAAAVPRVEEAFLRFRTALRRQGAIREVEGDAAAVGRALDELNVTPSPSLDLETVLITGVVAAIVCGIGGVRRRRRRPPLSSTERDRATAP